jgi:hypothetical protein
MATSVGPIQLKRGTSAQWADSNVPLRSGELGFDTTRNRLKVGDGGTLWADLPWVSNDAGTIAHIEQLAEDVETAAGEVAEAVATVPEKVDEAVAVAAANLPTFKRQLDVWPFSVSYEDGEPVFGLRPDGTFFPATKVEKTVEGMREDAISTGFRWYFRYEDGELAFGERTDGSFFPNHLGNGRPSWILVGDSLMAGWDPTQQAALASTVGPVVNIGIGGQKSFEIAARYGAQPARATVAGGSIPPSGSVNVTLDRRLRSDTVTPVDGSLMGVAGVFLATNDTDYLTGTFTRAAAGERTPVPDGTPFATGERYRSMRPIIRLGRNNFKSAGDPQRILADLQACLRWSKARDAIVLPIPPWTSDTAEETARREEANTLMRDAYPTFWLDDAAYLRSTATLASVGITATSQDTADIAAGNTPTSFRLAGDPGHFNAKAYEALRRLYVNTVTAKGLLTT